MRSAPTSAGLSILRATPVLMFRFTSSGSTEKYLRPRASQDDWMGGTTLATTIPSTAANWWLAMANSPMSTTASSSAVAAGSVWIRQLAVTSSSSKSPITVLVLPTSMASSME